MFLKVGYCERRLAAVAEHLCCTQGPENSVAKAGAGQGAGRRLLTHSTGSEGSGAVALAAGTSASPWRCRSFLSTSSPLHSLAAL